MKQIIFVFALAAILFTSCEGTTTGATTSFKSAPELKTELDTVSYIIGFSNGEGMRQQKVEINESVFFGAMNEGLEGEEPKIAMSDGALIVRKYMMKKREEEASNNQAQADEFLEKNKDAEGVITTESGLQYKVIKKGDGAIPTSTDEVKVNYHGTLIDGTVFDSSIEAGKPATFYANRVIKGWTEGLQLMPVGSKFKFFIKPDLAYGARQSGKIGPNSLLIFDVELLEILPKKEK